MAGSWFRVLRGRGSPALSSITTPAAPPFFHAGCNEMQAGGADASYSAAAQRPLPGREGAA